MLLPFAFSPVFVHSLHYVLFNDTIPRENCAELYKAIETAFNFQRYTDNYGKLFSMVPILTKLCPGACDYKILRESALFLREFIKNLLDEQIQTFDESHERNFVDLYVKKWRGVEQNSDETPTFSCKDCNHS